jgi:hypothetical protein
MGALSPSHKLKPLKSCSNVRQHLLVTSEGRHSVLLSVKVTQDKTPQWRQAGREMDPRDWKFPSGVPLFYASVLGVFVPLDISSRGSRS